MGAHHAQPLWALTVLATTFVDKGLFWANRFSKGYHKYDPGKTEAKYQEKLDARAQGGGHIGWPSCQAFEDAGCTKCEGCPFHGRIKSPLSLAERVAAPVIVVPEVTSADGLTFDLPEPYVVNDKGFICEEVTETCKDDTTVTKHLPLFMSRLRNFGAQAGRRALLCEVELDIGTWGPVQIDEIDMAGDLTLAKALRRDGVKPLVANEKRIRSFMTSLLAKIDAAQKRRETLPFGWVRTKDGTITGFAYGGRVVAIDGTEHKSGFADHNIADQYGPRGNLEQWMEALHVITEQNRPSVEVIVANSFGAVLMTLLGQNCGTLSAYAPEGGGGKSTAVNVGLAVWGSPQLTRETPMSSPKGLLHKMDAVRNLPIYWDEINSEEKMEDVRKIVGQVTEGTGGSLLFSDRTARRREHWQTLLSVTSNMSLIDSMMRANKSTDAQLHRVFEFLVPERASTPRRTSDVTQIIAALNHNYGIMGLKYQHFLATNLPAIQEFLTKTIYQFEDEVQHKSNERFRSTLAAVIYAGASFANQLGCDFHLPEMWQFLKTEYLKQRAVIIEADSIAGTKANTISAMTEFFKGNVRKTIWVSAAPVEPRKGRPMPAIVRQGPTGARPDEINIRCAIRNKWIDVSKSSLFDHMVERGYNGTAVVRGLRQYFGAEQVQRVDLAIGTTVGGGRETIIRIPVDDAGPFAPMLYRAATADEKPADMVSVEADGGTVDAEVGAVTETVAPKLELPGSALEAGIAQAAADLAKVRGS